MNTILQKTEDRKPAKTTIGYLAGVALLIAIGGACGALITLWIVWEKLKIIGIVDKAL